MVYLLQQLLSESASRYPEKPALSFRDETVTYAGLEAETNRLARGLAEVGVRWGERVGIYMNRSTSSVTAAFGVLKAGAVYVPIDPLCPPERLNYIVRKCGIEVVLAAPDKLRSIEQAFPERSPLKSIVAMNGPDRSAGQIGTTRVIDWQTLRTSVEADALTAATIDSDLAYILFTSGSTGSPKGVMLSHRNALTFVEAARDLFGITSDDRLSNICPLHFDMSVFDLYVAMKAGATTVIIPETTTTFPVKLAEVIEKNGITVWNSVPSALSLLAAYRGLQQHDLSSLRLVLFAGERFPLKYLQRLMEVMPGARFCNMYGQTEANSSTYYWIDTPPAGERQPIPIGKPLPNFDVFALDEQGARITEPAKEGELYVRASTVALGYWDEAEKTEKAFVQNPLRPDVKERVYRTGDLVHVDGDGNYVYVGRKDHMIKSRGYRIEIGEIEAVLRDHEGVKNAVVIPVPDELIGNRIWAIVVPLVPGSLAKDDLIQFCARRLPKYMLPEMLEFRDDLPTTSSGKVDRQLLRSQRATTAPASGLTTTN